MILHTIYTYTAYGFPIRAASSRSASASASAIFRTGYPMDDPQNIQIFVKIRHLVSEKFFETENIFFSPAPTGGPDAKILFLSTHMPPSAQKFLESPVAA